MKFTAMARTFGPIGKLTPANGAWAKCQARACSPGKMARGTKVISITTRKRDMVNSSGQTDVYLLVNGKMENSMEMAHYLTRKESVE